MASGLAYDMLRYIGDDGNVNIYPNYPYNDLSQDQYNYTSGKRDEFISHLSTKEETCGIHSVHLIFISTSQNFQMKYV